MIAEFVSCEVEPAPDWLIEHLCTTDALAFAGAMEAQATEPDLFTLAPRVDVPILLLVGVNEEDQEWLSRGRELAGRLPRGELVALEGAPHLAAFFRTDLSVPPMREFLANLCEPGVPRRGSEGPA